MVAATVVTSQVTLLTTLSIKEKYVVKNENTLVSSFDNPVL